MYLDAIARLKKYHGEHSTLVVRFYLLFTYNFKIKRHILLA